MRITTLFMLIAMMSTTGCLQQRLQQQRSANRTASGRSTQKAQRQRGSSSRLSRTHTKRHQAAQAHSSSRSIPRAAASPMRHEPKIAVRTKGKTVRVPLEQYVAGVVASEMPAQWPAAALQAQAIAARTYALWQMQQRAAKPYHVQTTVMNQVYNGSVSSQSAAAQAAQATRGVVVTWQGQLGHTYFHASCGDHTTSSQSVWGSAIPYLHGVSCTFCAKAGKQYRWSVSIDYNSLNKALRTQVRGRIRRVQMGKKLPCGRLQSVQLIARQKSELPATKLRQLLGYNRLPSTWITNINNTATGVVFSGQGHGHGVGMCQWGAAGMANAGYNAKQIIAHYYPATQLQRWY
ncbi:MAG: SpoIID/LytB domain-containing protein [Myxococcota bacterium]